MGKEVIAHYEQFLLFPQHFQKTYTADMKNQGLFGKGLHLSHKHVETFSINFVQPENYTATSFNIHDNEFNGLKHFFIKCYIQETPEKYI